MKKLSTAILILNLVIEKVISNSNFKDEYWLENESLRYAVLKFGNGHSKNLLSMSK